MKQVATLALMLNLAIAVYGRQIPLKMTFSGTAAASATNLQQPDTSNVEDNLTGAGTLGAFTFRNITAETTAPQPSSACSGPNKLNFARVAGGAVFRFDDGSLLKVSLTQGNDCVDFAAQEGHCTMTFKIIGGTGRFKDAYGTLTLTETDVPVLADAFHNPVYFASTGVFTGAISGVTEEECRDERR